MIVLEDHDDWPGRLTTVTTGVLLPHEIFASLYEFGNGHPFFALLAGLPQDAW